MNEEQVGQAASLLGSGRRQGRALDALPAAARPADVADGYAVQDALHAWQAAHGNGPIAGYKIGCTTRVMQDLLAIDSPCAGGVLAADVHTGPAAFLLSRFVRVGIECEVAVRLDRDVPVTGVPHTADTIADCVGACMAAVEVVDDRYRDFRAIGVPTLIADDFFHAAAVLGPPVEEWRGIDLGAVEGRTTVDGKAAGTGRGADVMGHPLNALAWLADILAARGRALVAGDIVLTGSMVAVQWLSSPAVATVEVVPLGTVEVSLSAD